MIYQRLWQIRRRLSYPTTSLRDLSQRVTRRLTGAEYYSGRLIEPEVVDRFGPVGGV